MTTDGSPLPLAASPSIATLVAALATAQGTFPEIGKDKRADIQTKSGGHFTYAYADLATVLAAVRAPLSANGLAVLQPVHVEGSRVRVTTVLAHASGEWVATDLTLPLVDGSDARGIASLITYARRYGVLALLGLAPADEDDDAGTGAKPRREKPTRATPVDEAAPSTSARPAPTPSTSPRRGRPDPDKTAITEKQRKYLFATAHDAGWSREQLKAMIVEAFGVEHTTELRVSEFDSVLALVHRGPPSSAAREPGVEG